MNASIDFWLDELDTQITEMSADELRDLRAGVPPRTSPDSRASDASRSRDSRSASDRDGPRLGWSHAPSTVLA